MKDGISGYVFAIFVAVTMGHSWSAEALTPTQSAASESKFKAEREARKKSSSEVKRSIDAAVKSNTVFETRLKVVNFGKWNAHNEANRNLEATRKAAGAHARILAAQQIATGHGTRRSKGTTGTPLQSVRSPVVTVQSRMGHPQ